MSSQQILLPALAGIMLLLLANPAEAFTLQKPSTTSIPTSVNTGAGSCKDSSLVLSMSATEESQGTVNIEFPFDDRAVRFAYDEWRIAFNKGDFDPVRFENFSKNYKALVVENLKERQKAINEGREPPVFRSLSEFGDWSSDEMNEGVRAGPGLDSGPKDSPRPTQVVNDLDEKAIQCAYDEWRIAFNKGGFDEVRYLQFKTNYIAMTKENLRARKAAIDAGLQPPTFKSLNEFGDWSLEEFQKAKQRQQAQDEQQQRSAREEALAIAQGTQRVSSYGTQPVTVNNVAVPSLTSEKEDEKMIKQYWEIYTTWCAQYNKKPLRSRLPIFINNYWTVSNYCDENPSAKFNLNEYADLTKDELYELSYQRGEKLSLNVVSSESKLQFSDGTKMQSLLDPDNGSKVGTIIETTTGNTYLCESGADDVAILVGWKQNADDGSITGYVFNKSGFKDGTKVTTSPIPIVATSDTIVKTQGGSMYRLLD